MTETLHAAQRGGARWRRGRQLRGRATQRSEATRDGGMIGVVGSMVGGMIGGAVGVGDRTRAVEAGRRAEGLSTGGRTTQKTIEFECDCSSGDTQVLAATEAAAVTVSAVCAENERNNYCNEILSCQPKPVGARSDAEHVCF